MRGAEGKVAAMAEQVEWQAEHGSWMLSERGRLVSVIIRRQQGSRGYGALHIREYDITGSSNEARLLQRCRQMAFMRD